MINTVIKKIARIFGKGNRFRSIISDIYDELGVRIRVEEEKIALEDAVERILSRVENFSKKDVLAKSIMDNAGNCHEFLFIDIEDRIMRRLLIADLKGEGERSIKLMLSRTVYFPELGIRPLLSLSLIRTPIDYKPLLTKWKLESGILLNTEGMKWRLGQDCVDIELISMTKQVFSELIEDLIGN